MKIIKRILAGLLFLAIVFSIQGIGGRDSRGGTNDEPFSLQDVRTLFPKADEITHVEGRLYVVKDRAGVEIGFTALGPPESSDITGYIGRVPFILALDPDMRIRDLKILPNRETPGYSKRVEEELRDAWTGLSPDRAHREKVDAVSGATATSMALIEGVQLTAADIAGTAIDRTTAERMVKGPAGTDWLLLLFLTGSVISFLLPGGSTRRRIFISVLSLIIPGFLAASLLSLALFGGWADGYFSWQANWLISLVFIASFALPLFTGRNFYCYNFCPFGSAQYIIGKIFKKKWRLGIKTHHTLKFVRIALITAALAVFIAGSPEILSLLEPFEAFRWPHASFVSRAIAVIFLLLSAVIQRPWCRICPTGGIIEAARRAGRHLR